MKINDLVNETCQLETEYKVTPEVYTSFQNMSNDFNPLHTDEAFAKDRGFRECVMYGNILNGFVSHFVGMVLPCHNVMICSQDICYRQPVYLNDKLIMKSSVDCFSEAVNTIIYKFKFYRDASVVAVGRVQIKILI